MIPDGLVSVCLASYNSGEYLEAAVTSVVEQTYKNWELIVVDDCSTDNTREVVIGVISRFGDPRIRFFTNPVRLGMVANWNRAVELANGQFIKVLGQDDILKPDCLALQVATMQRHPEVTVVTCARQVVGPTGKPILVRRCFPREGIYDGLETIRRCVLAGVNTIGEPVSVLFRASTLGTREVFEASILYCPDLDFWLRLLAHGDLYFIAEPKTLYRIHPAAATRQLEKESVADFFRLVDRVVTRGHFHLSPFRRKWLRMKVHALFLARRLIHRLLAGR
jgi:glycosyltransferase involved in cell wall biosynthesis